MSLHSFWAKDKSNKQFTSNKATKRTYNLLTTFHNNFNVPFLSKLERKWRILFKITLAIKAVLLICCPFKSWKNMFKQPVKLIKLLITSTVRKSYWTADKWTDYCKTSKSVILPLRHILLNKLGLIFQLACCPTSVI